MSPKNNFSSLEKKINDINKRLTNLQEAYISTEKKYSTLLDVVSELDEKISRVKDDLTTSSSITQIKNSLDDLKNLMKKIDHKEKTSTVSTFIEMSNLISHPCVTTSDGRSARRAITKDDIIKLIKDSYGSNSNVNPNKKYQDLSRFTYHRVSDSITDYIEKGESIPTWFDLEFKKKKILYNMIESMIRSIGALKLVNCQNNWAIDYIVEKKYQNKFYYLSKKGVKPAIKRRKLSKENVDKYTNQDGNANDSHE